MKIGKLLEQSINRVNNPSSQYMHENILITPRIIDT